MPYPVKAVANYFIDRGLESKVVITPMKLQKLMYYAHGWYLAITNSPLLDENVEAWEYGPVIPSIYHEFKIFGNSKIPTKTSEVNFDGSSGMPRITYPSIDDCPDKRLNETTKQILDRVWDVYGKYKALQLSTMTHAEGSPWAITWADNQGKKNTDIPDNLIRQHFIEKARGNEQRTS